MGTRGAIRAAVPPNLTSRSRFDAPAGSTVLDDDMSLEYVGVGVEDAIRINA